MKVLHIPVNIASQASTTIRVLRELGIDARGVFRNIAPRDESIDLHVLDPLDKHPIRGRIQRLKWWWAAAKALRWADVVHWHYRSDALPFRLDLRYLAMVNKPRIVEFWGTDVRIPEIVSADNPYLAKMYESMGPSATYRASYRAKKTLRRFSKFGFACAVPGVGIETCVPEKTFVRRYRTQARIIISDFEPRFPDPANRRPVILHAPTNPLRKGTDAILAAVDQLKKEFDFEFRLITDFVEPPKYLKIVQSCDILIDDVVYGCYGLNAIEGMAFGKVVVCYITPMSRRKYPPDLPVVNATQDTFVEALRPVLADAALRRDIGLRGRAYAEKYHDAYRICRDLIRIYEELIEAAGWKRGSRR